VLPDRPHWERRLNAPIDIPAILHRIAAGEQPAFAELVDHFQRPLFGFLGRMGMSQAQAEDIAQETFVRVWTQLHRYQPARAQFSTWLYTIARNLAFNALQSAPRQRDVPAEDIPEQACEQAGPAQALERAQQHAHLQSALRQLPMIERSALALVYVHELGLADVARIEGDSVAAIKTRLHRAKYKLREILREENTCE
jgi:RNA polymerase sigma-70 factor (ECF subfamily)